MTNTNQKYNTNHYQDCYSFLGGVMVFDIGESDLINELMPLQSEPLPSQLEKSIDIKE